MRVSGSPAPDIVTATEAVRRIKDGDSLLLEASGGGVMEPSALVEALALRYLETGAPRGLSLMFCSGVGDRQGSGAGRLAHRGLLKRVIAGHWGMAPALGDLLQAEEIEGYNLPQGVLAQLLREVAAGRPGLITTTGLETFCDPRYGGGRLNSVTSEDLVELITLDDRQYLRYLPPRFDFGFIRGTTADERGNITLEHEAARLGVLAAAMAVRNSGGVVIAQVKRIAEWKTLSARDVVVPGHLVDYLVVDEDQWQTTLDRNNPAYSGEVRVPHSHSEPMPLTERKVVARRALAEIRSGSVVNLGVGMADGVASVAAEEGRLDEITLTVEQGLVGGVPARGVIFGCSWNPEAIIDASAQFDFYDGGGLDVTCLGFAEVDVEGNVNSSLVDGRVFGAGGFINISQSARTVVFCGTLTAGGLRCSVVDARLRIDREGQHRKFVRAVRQRTFSAARAYARQQRVIYVTERAVFTLCEGGLELIEVAEGIEVDSILALMDFAPRISKDLRVMDPGLFAEGPLSMESGG
jgi:acyl CoA:acetate/3-ketoacid CoA transferase